MKRPPSLAKPASKARGQVPPRWRGPVILDDAAFTALEGIIGLNSPNEEFRNDVAPYLFDFYWTVQHPAARWSHVRQRLESLHRCASELQTLLRGSPQFISRQERRRDAYDQFVAKSLSREAFLKIATEMAKFSDIDDPECLVLEHVKSLLSEKVGLDVADVSEQLRLLCEGFEFVGKEKGGRPARRGWDSLMRGMAKIFEKWTAKKATVTEDEHKAEAGERYSGDFVSFVTVVDKEASAGLKVFGVEPRPNSALGPALRRLRRVRTKTR